MLKWCNRSSGNQSKIYSNQAKAQPRKSHTPLVGNTVWFYPPPPMAQFGGRRTASPSSLPEIRESRMDLIRDVLTWGGGEAAWGTSLCGIWSGAQTGSSGCDSRTFKGTTPLQNPEANDYWLGSIRKQGRPKKKQRLDSGKWRHLKMVTGRAQYIGPGKTYVQKRPEKTSNFHERLIPRLRTCLANWWRSCPPVCKDRERWLIFLNTQF